MKFSFSRRDGVVSLLDTALHAEQQEIETHSRRDPHTAESLAPVLAALQDWRQRMDGLAHEGVSLMRSLGSISSSSGEFARDFEAIVGEVSDTSGVVRNIASAAAELDAAAEQVATCAKASREKVASSNEGVSSFLGHMELLERAIQKVAQDMEQMVGLSREIDKLASVVKEVGNQTRVLSLNAAIEAASAGDAGRGFAVVAREVKELAQQSDKAIVDIERIATAMTNIARTAGDSTAQCLESLGQSNDEFEVTVISLSEIGGMLSTLNAHASEISSAAAEQSLGTMKVAEGLESIAGSLDAERGQLETLESSAGDAVTSVERQLDLLCALAGEKLKARAELGKRLLFGARVRTAVAKRQPLQRDGPTDVEACSLYQWLENLARTDVDGNADISRDAYRALWKAESSLVALTNSERFEEAEATLRAFDENLGIVVDNMNSLLDSGRS